MKRIKTINGTIEIDCDDKMCGSCKFRADPKCSLFDVLIDHIVGSNPNSKRCLECIDAEVKADTV